MLVVVCKGTTDSLCECVLLLFGMYIKYDTMAYVIIWIYECIVYAFIQLRALLYILQLIFWQNELWRIARITVSGSLNRLNLAFICITILVFFSTSSEWYFHFLEDTDAVYILHLSEFVVCKGERLMWQMTLRNGLQQAIVFGYVWVISYNKRGRRVEQNRLTQQMLFSFPSTQEVKKNYRNIAFYRFYINVNHNIPIARRNASPTHGFHCIPTYYAEVSNHNDDHHH